MNYVMLINYRKENLQNAEKQQQFTEFLTQAIGRRSDIFLHWTSTQEIVFQLFRFLIEILVLFPSREPNATERN